jgi:secreted PhoX family phosphatase
MKNKYFSKRTLGIVGSLFVSSFLSAQIGFDPEIDFELVPDEVIVPASPIQKQVIFIGGHDTVQTTATYGNPSGAYPAKQWHDFIGFTPDTDPNSGDLGWVSVNHEMISSDPNIGDGGGMTVFKIRRDPATDSIVVVEQTLADGRTGKYFNVDFANTVGETGMNCGGITSEADGRIWTAEEWFRNDNASIYANGAGVLDTTDFTINGSGISIADGETIKKFENFNWMVEVDPREAVAIRKQYNWGRQPFEGGVVMPDNQTVYTGADNTPGILSKFIADVPGDFTSGKLYAYREDDQNLRLSHRTSLENAYSEISAYDEVNQRIYSTNSEDEGLLVSSFANTYELDSIDFIDLSAFGEPTSVAVHNGIIAVSIPSQIAQNIGQVLFFDGSFTLLNSLTVGVLPDMLTFTPDGSKVVVANEAEPNDDYTIDPEGSVSIIDLSNGTANATVSQITFGGLTSADVQGARIFGQIEGPAANDLFFSEYAEGSSNNKYIEIYNGTGADVDLSNYSLSSCSNGCNTIGEFDFPDNVTFATGTILADGETYVIYHPNAAPEIVAEGDQPFTFLSNGDDYFALTLAGATASNYTIIDEIGAMGPDPGNGWNVAGVTDGTQNHTLVRKPRVIGGNTDFISGAGTNSINSEWRVYPQDSLYSIGSHEMNSVINSTIAQDLEPEFVAVNASSTKAYVVCQENNAILVIDLQNETIEDVIALGYKDYSLAANAIDASDEDGIKGNFVQYDHLFGMYMPDMIEIVTIAGNDYIITANEGDSRDYSGYSEEARVRDLILDPVAFPNAAVLQQDENLGRLKVTTSQGDIDDDGDFDELYSYGGRSFTIWDLNGNIIFDSGNEFGQIMAERFSSNYANNRDDDKGSEPESITVGTVNGRTFAFIGLERSAGVMVYDVTDPANAEYVHYFNKNGVDESPEGLIFIDGAVSPDGKPYLVSTNEPDDLNGSVSIYNVNGFDGNKWIEIDNGKFDKMLNFEEEAINAGATMFNRLEWVAYNESDGNIYITETGRDNPAGRWRDEMYEGGVVAQLHNDRATAQGTNPMSGDYVDYYGRIIKLDVSTDDVTVALEAGPEFHNNPNVPISSYPDVHLSNPDGLTFMTVDQTTYMVICEDLNGTSHGRMPAGISNRSCELYILDMTIQNPSLNDLVRIAQTPVGAEVTGVRATPDGKTLFFNSQHPSTSNPFPYNNSLTIALTGWDQLDDVGLESENLQENGFNVYPNPTSRYVYFDETMDIAIYNSQGKLIRVERDTKTLDIMGINPGTYFIKNEKGQTKKLIIQ